MKCVSFLKCKVTNPESGEVKDQIRVVTDSGAELKILHNDKAIETVEEIKALGTPKEVLAKLKISPTKYGGFIALVRPYDAEAVTW